MTILTFLLNLYYQELLYAKCISEEDYNSCKRRLLQRMAVQGAKIEAKNVIMAKAKDPKGNSEEEWSVIDLKDDKSLMNKENLNSNSNSKSKTNQGSGLKQIKGAASVFGFVKHGKNGTEKSIFDSPSLNSKESGSILMEESGAPETVKENGSSEKFKRKPFRSLFHWEQREGNGGNEVEQRGVKSSVKKQWGFDGFKKWKRNDLDDETAPLPLNQRSDSEAYSDSSSQPFGRTLGEGPDTKLIKKKLHSHGSPSDFFIDKVFIPSTY